MLGVRLTVAPTPMSLGVSRNQLPPTLPKKRPQPRRKNRKRLPLRKSAKMRLIASVLSPRKRLRRRKLIRSVPLERRPPKKQHE